MQTSQPHPEPHSSQPSVELYRMVMPEHVCPYGLKSKWLLEREGFEVHDHPLSSREETDEFKRKHDVETTPQSFIEGKRVGGYEELRKYFGKSTREEGEESYQPIVAVFSMALLAALALSLSFAGPILSVRTIEWFVALSMTMLAMLKLQDVRSFSTMFLNYDLLAKRWVPYGFVYPFAEALVAFSMLAGVLVLVPFAAPIALFIGLVGAASVIKAVWIDKREIKCACVGGSSNVPLGFVSLTENLTMVGMGLWMLAKPFVMA